MLVNGEQVKLDAQMSLADYLSSNGYDPSRIAVERNGDIVSKSDYTSVMLDPEDIIEIVQFVGGG